jgi:hypothetical protein
MSVWSSLGKILLRAAPIALEVAEATGHSGGGKAIVFQKAVTDSIAEFRPDIAKHPKVISVLQKVADANIEAHNVISQVLAENPQ